MEVCQRLYSETFLRFQSPFWNSIDGKQATMMVKTKSASLEPLFKVSAETVRKLVRFILDSRECGSLAGSVYVVAVQRPLAGHPVPEPEFRLCLQLDRAREGDLQIVGSCQLLSSATMACCTMEQRLIRAVLLDEKDN